MIDVGIFNFCLFDNVDGTPKAIDTNMVYYAPVFDFIINGPHESLGIYNYANNENAGANIDPFTWEINGVQFMAHRVTFSPAIGEFYYLKVGSSHSINLMAFKACDLAQLYVSNDCDNSHAPWFTQGITLFMPINGIIEGPTEFEDEQRQIVRASGIEKKTINQVQKKSIQFVGVAGLNNMLNALKTCSNVVIASFAGDIRIKNIAVEKEEINNGTHFLYTLIFEHWESESSLTSCCDSLNLDDLLSVELDSANNACGSFSVAIESTDNTLDVVLADPPPGVVIYKWYRNGVYVSSAAFLDTTSPGDYRVEVLIEGCRAIASYYVDDACKVFQIAVSVANGVISAVASNIPPGQSGVQYLIKKDDVTVGYSVPYTVQETGTYFIEAISGPCRTIKGQYVALGSACDYSIIINDLGNELEAITNANNPVYTWELETASGRTIIANTQAIPKTSKGIYWLTIALGSCSKETYIYVEPSSNTVCSVIAKASGTEFSIYEIDLLGIANPGADLLVTVNGVGQSYVSSVPSLQNTYSINSLGKLIFASSFPLSNALIKVIQI